jgi:hypothetical protein
MTQDYTSISVTEETIDNIKSHLRGGERYDDLLRRMLCSFEETTRENTKN